MPRARPGPDGGGGVGGSRSQSRWLIHTVTWAGSSAWCTTPARSSWTASRSTAFKSGRERCHGLVSVVAGPVEPAVDHLLDPAAQRVNSAATARVETATATGVWNGSTWVVKVTTPNVDDRSAPP